MWNDTVIDVIRKAPGPQLDLSVFKLGCFPLTTIEERRKSLAQLLSKLKYLEPAARSALVHEIGVRENMQPAHDLMMTSEQVSAMSAAGMTIGAHTMRHPILARIPEDEARTEMAEGKARLEAIVGHEVTLFAYPNGKPGTDYAPAHVRLAREVGFTAACSTGWGTATAGSDMFQLPRFTPWDKSRVRYALRLAMNMRHPSTQLN
ncbi:MAG TPA: polysaccharide deacetylase family protein, partial [Burkholderiales bacterium]|nr:polysaccharide deacetylase family protein [Burkholderiales bacterium]